MTVVHVDMKKSGWENRRLLPRNLLHSICVAELCGITFKRQYILPLWFPNAFVDSFLNFFRDQFGQLGSVRKRDRICLKESENSIKWFDPGFLKSQHLDVEV